MNDFWYNFLRIVFTLTSLVLTYYVIPFIKNMIATSDNEQLKNFIDITVRAVEQAVGGGNGGLKKEEVVEQVHKWLTNKGLKITEEQLDGLIEAAVYNMNMEKKLVATVDPGALPVNKKEE